MNSKKCYKCKKYKTYEEFHKGSKKGGRTGVCKICHQIYTKKWYKENRELIKKRSRERYIQRKEYFRNYWNTHDKTPEAKKKRRARYHQRIKKDINYKIKKNLRTRIYHLLKGLRKTSSILNYLDCSVEELKIYLESQFIKGMSWNNYGEWHVDHIKPCCSFDLNKEEDKQICFHYTNLQPLWAKDNLVKGARYHVI